MAVNKEGKEYKSKVLFARVSKEGNHIFMFNHDEILNPKYASLLLNKTDMDKLLSGEFKSIKVSAMEVKEDESK